jgi:hypothetical protein
MYGGSPSHLQAIHCKDTDRLLFLASSHVQITNNGREQYDEGEIGQDIDSCVG